MDILKLDYIKQHSRIVYDCEDALLEFYCESAEKTMFQCLNRTYWDVFKEYGEIPAPIRHALLMLVDASYNQRSPYTAQQARVSLYGFETLVKPYIRLTGCMGGGDNVQTVPKGSDVKIEFTADLPDNLLLKDIDFECAVINADTNKLIKYEKDQCIMSGSGEYYVVLVNTTDTGVGTLMLTLTVHIPDTDYQVGYRKEIVDINPNIRVTG